MPFTQYRNYNWAFNLSLTPTVCLCRGEAAFCSKECRQQKMNLDELMETKCFPPAGGGGGSDQSGKGTA
jgi:hypothetical protein